MARDITPAAAAQCVAPQVRLALFGELHFNSSVEYVWSGSGPIAWNGHTWQGLGALGKVQGITEDSALNAQGVMISLSGIDSNMLSEALGEIRQGLPVKLWLSFFNGDGSIVADPILCFAGRMDQPAIDESTDTSTISILVENRLADLQRRLCRRFTDQDQRLDYPGDPIFSWVGMTFDYTASWGAWPHS